MESGKTVDPKNKEHFEKKMSSSGAGRILSKEDVEKEKAEEKKAARQSSSK